MDVQELIQNGAVMGDPLPAPRKPVPPRSLGRPEFDKEGLTEFQALPPDKQKEELKASWADAAYILAERLKRFSMTVSRKDFGRLQQLATSAGVAYDKVIPKGESQNLNLTQNVMFNLFGSLGGDKIMRILMPPVPKPLKELENGHPGEDRPAGGEDSGEGRGDR